ncbi:MAG: hypothetical protein PHC61_01100 [Chitinivibrionales bacterium]|nr:hypothetical protein [Chitinivibrionales bacterium]
MRAVVQVIRNELRIFTASDRSTFFIYAVLILTWSFLFSVNTFEKDDASVMLWWIFFSVVISGNFSTTIFVLERTSGALEVIITSGFSRRALMLGKILFVLGVSIVMAWFCIGLAFIGRTFFSSMLSSYFIAPPKTYMGLYIAASFMNAAFGAYFSIRLPNPRLVSFAAVLLVGALVSVYYGISAIMPLSPWILAVLFCAIGALWLVLALREFESERVTRPITN